jgi:hypothetical protein
MTGRAEVYRLRQVLDDTFKRATAIGPDPELQSDFARYLCVLVSGFLEKAVVEVILEHSRRHSQPSIQRFIEYRSRRMTNVNTQQLQDLLGTFDAAWRTDLEKFLVDERKAAVDSVVSLRHSISHGQSVGVTIVRVRDYYAHIRDVIEHVTDLCVP